MVTTSLVAARFHDYAPRRRAAVLATPAFHIRLYVPQALRLAQKLRIMRYVPSYVTAHVAAHDPAQRGRHEQDVLISHAISTRILARSARHRYAADSDAAAIHVPTLVLVAGPTGSSSAPRR